jgi:predicted adenine nucleotide alpha hydrolase (AANH) superfamily ATPase
VKVLLHTCCGPCACACIPQLKAQGHEVSLFFSNSNIDTAQEFEKRLAAAKRLAEEDEVELVVDDYNHKEWLEKVAANLADEPEKGARCTKCFRYNLSRTAAYAAKCGFDAFATSLTVSPHKVSRVIFESSDDERFMKADFKKREGFKLSLKRSAQLGLYRQDYCGCEFSRRKRA